MRQWVSLETEAAPEAHSSDEADASELHPIAVEFSLGVHGEAVGTDLVNKVDRIIKALIAGTSDAEYSVDEDGAVSFEATLSSGLFIMCEVSLAGNINAGLYDGADGGLERFLTRPTEGRPSGPDLSLANAGTPRRYALPVHSGPREELEQDPETAAATGVQRKRWPISMAY